MQEWNESLVWRMKTKQGKGYVYRECVGKMEGNRMARMKERMYFIVLWNFSWLTACWPTDRWLMTASLSSAP